MTQLFPDRDREFNTACSEIVKVLTAHDLNFEDGLAVLCHLAASSMIIEDVGTFETKVTVLRASTIPFSVKIELSRGHLK
jgi:hypothetical protein